MQERLPNLTFAEARDLLTSAQRSTRVPKAQSKIEHLVVLFVENRAADHVFGCMLGDRPEFDGIPTRPDGGHWKLFPQTPNSTTMVNVSCGTAKMVCRGLPHEQTRMFSGEQLPVKRAISEHFGVFNKYFTSVPGPSWPNHIFAQSATSCGIDENVMYNRCGGGAPQFPQMTIFDSLAQAKVPFSIFVNDTCGPRTNFSCGDVKPGWGTNTGTNTSTGLDPDVTMAGVARHKDRFFSHSLFYEQAASGTLPAVSWISPAHEASDHPCFDMAKGERLLKDVYEALRNGPGWNHTLFLAAYDDYGGFFDHVKPPAAPHDESPCNVWNAQHGLPPTAPTRCTRSFDFQALGVRSTSMLMSPWIAKGSIINEPTQRGDRNASSQGPPPQWEHASILATAKNLFNLPDFLTRRDAWAGSFDELLLDTPRTDTPYHLPRAPQNATPWGPPHVFGDPDEEEALEVDMFFDDGDDDDDDDDDDDHGGGGRGSSDGQRRRMSASADYSTARTAPPQHCSLSHVDVGLQACQGPRAVTAKQRNLIELYSALTRSPMPDVGSMNSESASAWAKARFAEYMAMLDA